METTKAEIIKQFDDTIAEIISRKNKIAENAFEFVKELKAEHEREQEVRALAEKMNIAEVDRSVLNNLQRGIKSRYHTKQLEDLYDRLTEGGFTDQQICDAIDAINAIRKAPVPEDDLPF